MMLYEQTCRLKKPYVFTAIAGTPVQRKVKNSLESPFWLPVLTTELRVHNAFHREDLIFKTLIRFTRDIRDSPAMAKDEFKNMHARLNCADELLAR
jgi:hypothetical protein